MLLYNEIEQINENNRFKAKGPYTDYTLRDLAVAIIVHPSRLSRYCTINEETGLPKERPSLHVVIKIIGVLGLKQEDAYTLIRITMHCIDDDSDYKFLSSYRAIANDSFRKSRNKSEAEATLCRVNAFLSRAVRYGSKVRCKEIGIRSVFLRF